MRLRQLKLLQIFIWLIGLSNWSGFAIAFEENSKFCIHTAPMLLADIEKQLNPTEGYPHCEVLATTMTLKEKESFLSTMCKNLSSTHTDNYHFFQLRNGDLKGRGSYHDICDGQRNPLLAWMPYKMLQRNFAQELNPKERMNYIAKATDVDREKTELCHFRHSDLVTNISENLFTCIVMIFEDNFYGLDSNINVLVEIQPIMYEVRNITYLPWSNVTASYKTLLGKTTLKNPSRETKQIYGSINYAYVEKVKVNETAVYGETLQKLPLLFEHKGAVLELDGDGIGGVDVKEKAYFGRAMDAKSTVDVEVIGQWAEHSKEFTADIYEYFGYGVKRFRQEMRKGSVSFVRIESTEPVYELPESSHLTSATLHRPRDAAHKFERLSEERRDNSTESSASEWDEAEIDGNGSPYPEFYPWFVASALIVGVVLLVITVCMVRSCSQKEEKKKYKLAAMSP